MAMSRASSSRETKASSWGESSEYVLGRELLMVNCTTKVGNRTETSSLSLSPNLSCTQAQFCEYMHDGGVRVDKGYASSALFTAPMPA